jgi:hypothetical protein
MLSNRWMLEALDDFVQKASHNEALGNGNRNAAGAEIEEFVLIDLPRSRAVGAADVIGEDFQTGHRVRFGVVAQEKIANFLIGIGEMGVWFYSNQPLRW